MMKHSPLAVLLTACILCCGCTASNPAQSRPDDGSEPEPLLTDVTDKPVLTESAVLTKQVPDETTEPKRAEPDVLILDEPTRGIDVGDLAARLSGR